MASFSAVLETLGIPTERICILNVVDGPLLRKAEGLPYVFDSFVSRGTTTTDAVFGDASTLPGTSRNIRRALSLDGAMIEFPQR